MANLKTLVQPQLPGMCQTKLCVAFKSPGMFFSAQLRKKVLKLFLVGG